jgi:hypothetical protein
VKVLQLIMNCINCVCDRFSNDGGKVTDCSLPMWLDIIHCRRLIARLTTDLFPSACNHVPGTAIALNTNQFNGFLASTGLA